MPQNARAAAANQALGEGSKASATRPRRNERRTAADRHERTQQPAQRPRRDGRSRQDADDRGACDRRVPPDGDQEQNREEEDADQRPEEQTEAGIRRPGAGE
jgi:hypothetical protein